MEEFVEQALLFDFYGELLTEHQKRVLEDMVVNDLSISEIADEQGISRQAVHDIVKRSRKSLEEYEDKLHLVEKFLYIKQRIGEINQLVTHYDSSQKTELMEQVKNLTDRILEEL